MNGHTLTFSELEARNRELNEFADRVAHRLKRTLVNLSAYGEEIKSLLEAEEPETAIELVDEQIAVAAEGARVVQDFLRYAQSGGKLNLEPCSLRAIVAAVVRDVRSDRVRIEGNGFEHTILADPRLLGGAIHDLVVNALKYSPPDKLVRVRVEAHHQRVSVIDEGIGIAPQDQARIFDKFERVTALAAEQSTGLGLPFAKEVVERHGGQLRVLSEVGKGSAFIIELPGNHDKVTR
jgi:two-component system, OmpR family, sensor histidine kinase SenX3